MWCCEVGVDQANDPNKRDNSSSFAFFFFFFGFSGPTSDLDLFSGLLVGCNEVLDIDMPRSASRVAGVDDVGCFAGRGGLWSSFWGNSFDIEALIAARTASSAIPSGACWLSAASCEKVLWVSVFALMWR